jgi:Kef-type K+ transport system membrane component KefB
LGRAGEPISGNAGDRVPWVDLFNSMRWPNRKTFNWERDGPSSGLDLADLQVSFDRFATLMHHAVMAGGAPGLSRGTLEGAPMPELSLSNLVAVVAVAFAVPLLLGLVPWLRLPSAVGELVAGIVLGPSLLGWVEVDLPLQVLAVLGLAFLLFLAGLEIDVDGLRRGGLLALAGAGFGLSFALALAVAAGLGAAGLVDTPLLVAIVLTATGLGIVVPVLKDAGETGSAFGQLVVTGASIADFGAVVLLSLLFSREASGPGVQLLLIGGLVALAVAIGFGLARAGRSPGLAADLDRLEDTSAQIRVRGAVLLLALLVLVAQELGLELILGAFLAGAVLRVVDRDQAMTHPRFRLKLEAVGFGLLVPVFFVVSGLRFDLAALTEDAGTLRLVPLFAVALLVVRGVPALLYRRRIGARRTLAAALLQATSLSFIVAATQIGIGLGRLDAATGAALVAAGLVSVLLFPLLALTILRGQGPVAEGSPVSDASPGTPAAGPPSSREGPPPRSGGRPGG